MDAISNGGSRKAPRRRAVLVLAVSALAVLIVGGTALAATKRCPADCFGTKKADTLVGNAQGHDFFGRAGSDVVRARGGEDNLYGQAGADRLLAGPGPYDYLEGGTGDDAIEGGGGIDLYYFGDGWGRDSLRDATVGNRAIFESYGGDPISENLIIRLAPGPGPEVKTADGRNRISWEGSPIEYAVGGDGNDEISGDENGGRIVGGSGDDRIFANGGDDEVLAHGDGGGDTVDCGEGLDEVYYDPGDQVYANCEDKTPVN